MALEENYHDNPFCCCMVTCVHCDSRAILTDSRGRIRDFFEGSLDEILGDRQQGAISQGLATRKG
jgi:hypothetical protein